MADLHQDILSPILAKIDNPCENIQCSAVVSSTSDSKRVRNTLPHTIPALILSQKNPSTRKLVNFNNDSPPLIPRDISWYERCLGSYRGWLVVEKAGLSYLYHPFLNILHCLPTLNKKVYKVVLSSSPTFDMDCAVLILFESNGAAFFRIKDDFPRNFTLGEDCKDYFTAFSDGLFYEGRFCVIDDFGRIYSCNLDQMVLEEIECQPPIVSKLVRHKYYLVEIQGQFCTVVRKFSCNEEFYYECNVTDNQESGLISTREFRVMRMDPRTNEWISVRDLGEYALFLGCNNSISVNESEMSGRMKGNKIYFTDDRQKNCKHFGIDNPGRDVGVYDMADTSIEPLYSDPFLELMDDPGAVWVTPLPW